MDDFHSLYGRYPDVSVCDVGYGSEENYLYAFRHGIETFIKYNFFITKKPTACIVLWDREWKDSPMQGG
jgi:hypothetical protein